MTEDVRAYALRLLGQRSYTERNLRRKLSSKGFPEAAVDGLITRLLATGILDDQRYAISYARSRLVGGSASPRRVQQLLVRKGVPLSAAAAAISQIVDEENLDTSASLERIARRKAASLGDLDAVVFRRRLYGFLARRGYELDSIRRVIERITSEQLRHS